MVVAIIPIIHHRSAFLQLSAGPCDSAQRQIEVSAESVGGSSACSSKVACQGIGGKGDTEGHDER